MAGVCQHCGEVVRTLSSCPVCAAKVCADCIQEFGCAICNGRASAESGPESGDAAEPNQEEEY